VDFSDYSLMFLYNSTDDPRGDFNKDGTVNITDKQLMFANMGEELGRRTLGDVNGDDYVGLDDLAILEDEEAAGVSCLADLNGDAATTLAIDEAILGERKYRVSAQNLTGDINGDDLVDDIDVDLMLATFGSTWAQADIDGSGQVTAVDLLHLLGSYGVVAGMPLDGDIDGNWVVDDLDQALFDAVYNTNGYWPQADLNADGVVDDLDLALVTDNQGLTYSQQFDGDINGDCTVDDSDVALYEAVLGTIWGPADFDGSNPVSSADNPEDLNFGLSCD